MHPPIFLLFSSSYRGPGISITLHYIDSRQRSFEHALQVGSSDGEMATSRTMYALKIRHFSIVRLTNSFYDASREDGRPALARTLWGGGYCRRFPSRWPVSS